MLQIKSGGGLKAPRIVAVYLSRGVSWPGDQFVATFQGGQLGGEPAGGGGATASGRRRLVDCGSSRDESRNPPRFVDSELDHAPLLDLYCELR